MQEFTQLGIAGATLAILLVVVRFFIQTLDKKDAYIQDITQKFSDTVNTHLANENIAREREMEALTRVLNVLDEHTKVLGSVAAGIATISTQTSKIKYGRRKGDKTLIQ
jgi:hypothetical protein